MKLKLTVIACIALIFASCKKSEIKTSPLASITTVNAIYTGTTAKLGSNATTISNNASAQLAVRAGTEQTLYVWPTGDSAHPYYNNPKFAPADRDVYSLFLTGTPGAPEGILVKETIPYRTDSTAGIRFINLSPNTNGKPLFITLSSASSTVDVNNLGYKQYNTFKSYPGLYNSAYTFEVRNDTSVSPHLPLATFPLTTSTVPRFANITLVIRQNGTTGVSIYRVNNDR